MFHIRGYVFALLVTSCFACKNTENIVDVNNFIKTWQSTERPMPFRATLSINKDSTYYYNQLADLNSGFSQGFWTYNPPYIVLTSYLPDSCLYIKEYGKDWHSTSENTKEIISRTTHTDCVPISDVKYVIFENDSFYISNDSLFHSSEPNNIFPFYINAFE